MAKKKRKRTTQPRHAAGTATAFEGDRVGSSAERGAPAPIKPAPATPGGPSRIERKEAARRARERLRRQMARRRTYRRIGIALIAAVVVARIALLANRPKGSALTKEERDLVAAAPAAMKTAGCGAIQTIKEYPNGNDRTHIATGSAG